MIEWLAHRMKALAELLSSPIFEGDIKEEGRRKTLERQIPSVYIQERGFRRG